MSGSPVLTDIVCDDSSGQLYITDFRKVLVLSPGGEILKSIGDHHIWQSDFTNLAGFALGRDHSMYISRYTQMYNKRVSVVTADGSQVIKAWNGGGGMDMKERMNSYMPIRLAVDSDGVLYVCEFNNNRIVIY